MDDLLPAIEAELRSGQSVALSTVIGRRGSLPMSHRARMLVRADGSTEGTVGGGCLEAEVWAVSRRVLEQGRASVNTYHLTEIEDGIHGHVCGGTVTILTEPLVAEGPDGVTLHLYARLRELLESGRGGAVATPLPSDEDGESSPNGFPRILVEDQGCANRNVKELDSALLQRCWQALQDNEPTVFESEGALSPVDYFIDPVVPLPRVVVFGAGHCGRAIAELAGFSGFRVAVVDDRATFADAASMLFADEVHVLKLGGSLEPLALCERDFIVIVTRGHEHDLTVLRQILAGSFRYIGMIGSERKKHLFLQQLASEGYTNEQLATVCSPMGLPIAADTPQEIAVAVVGEMISVRRGVAIDESMRSGSSSRRRARTRGGSLPR